MEQGVQVVQEERHRATQTQRHAQEKGQKLPTKATSKGNNISMCINYTYEQFQGTFISTRGCSPWFTIWGKKVKCFVKLENLKWGKS